MCQLEKPRANEITEPLAFTVCRLKLRGKAIVLQSRSRRTRFNRQLWEKRNETNQGASAARVQGDSRFSRGQQRTKRKEKSYFHKTKPNRGESAAA